MSIPDDRFVAGVIIGLRAALVIAERTPWQRAHGDAIIAAIREYVEATEARAIARPAGNAP